MCTHVLVEDSGVSAQVLRLGHQVVQFLPSLQEALHGVVLPGKSVSSPHGGATTKAHLESSHAPPAGMNARMQQRRYLDSVCMAVSRC